MMAIHSAGLARLACALELFNLAKVFLLEEIRGRHVIICLVGLIGLKKLLLGHLMRIES